MHTEFAVVLRWMRLRLSIQMDGTTRVRKHDLCYLDEIAGRRECRRPVTRKIGQLDLNVNLNI
jgi:hypothetical protein